MKSSIFNYKPATEKGFTLIEMVIVIVVIGILMGLTFNGIGGLQANARDTRRTSDLKQVQSYLELYFNKCGIYPGPNDCNPAGNDPASWAAFQTVVESTVADTGDIPNDPKIGFNYSYYVAADNLSYVIRADMEKTKPRGGLSGDTYGTITGTGCSGVTIYCLTN